MVIIAALSTAPQKSGIGVIRISGDGALGAAKQVFRPFKGALSPRRMTYGGLYNRDGVCVDRILAVYFDKPNTFTGEDVVELHCHGSPAVLNAALKALFLLGVRQALPGEFTKRAFLNGRLDLTQAEAVGELIEAESEQLAANAAAQLDGALTREMTAMYERLILVLANYQAVVDYPDEDIDEPGQARILELITCEVGRLDSILAMSERASILKTGIRCAIVGKPNVGKSSLLNALAGYDRAIVTAEAGTTRDIVETEIVVGGIPLRLQDTAGVRNAEGEIERIGVELAKKAGRDAGLVLWVLDGSEPFDAEDFARLELPEGKPVIAVVNKSDLPQKTTENMLRPFARCVVSLSAKECTGLELLEAEIKKLCPVEGVPFDGTVITSARQIGACTAARTALKQAESAINSGSPPDMPLYDIEQACGAIAGLIGRNTPEDIVESIFANFCVGK